MAVARAILLRGNREPGSLLQRKALLKAAGDTPLTTYRSAGEFIGAHRGSPGLRFFDGSTSGRIAFGPGAGLAVGVSIGAQSVRAALVDANGWVREKYESERLPQQLAREPRIVLERVRNAAAIVLQRAFEDGRLLVDGALPLLGWAVAWPTPVNREQQPVSHALEHPSWRNGQPLDQRIRTTLGVRDMTTYAMNDAHAAAIAVAHLETHHRDYLRWRYPRLTIVLRVAGNIGGAVIVIEPPQRDGGHGDTSGFVDSVLLGGVDSHAGQVGHAPVSTQLLGDLNATKPEGLGEIEGLKCSCAPPDDEPAPSHLESFASVLPLTRRTHPDLERGEALDAILADPGSATHKRALQDVGAIIGDTLIGPVTMLNPAHIVLSGSLAVPAVHDEIERRLARALTFGTLPDVSALSGDSNDYSRAAGAALALIRNQVHRRLDELLDDERSTVTENIRDLTRPLAANPL